MTNLALNFDLVTADQIEQAIAIESQGFPPDEAASLESFRSVYSYEDY